MPNTQENEFSIFGINKLWRQGILYSFMTILTIAVVYLYWDNKRLNREVTAMSEKRAQENKATAEMLLDIVLKRVEPKIDAAIENVTDANLKIDSVKANIKK